MKTLNSVLVRIDKSHETITESGIHLPVMEGFESGDEYVRIHGIVTAIPDRLTGKLNGHIDPIIKIGDKVYFHYLGKRDEVFEKEFIVDYFNILCLVRDGEIRPVGDWALFEPYFEDEVQEIDLSEFEIVGLPVLGKKKVVMSKSGLVTTTKPKPSAISARVCYIEGHDQVSSGDLVLLTPKFEFKNTIEGKEYFCSKKEYILAKKIKNHG